MNKPTKKIKLTGRTRRGLLLLVPLAEGYLCDGASEELPAAERKEMLQAMDWIKQECKK